MKYTTSKNDAGEIVEIRLCMIIFIDGINECQFQNQLNNSFIVNQSSFKNCFRKSFQHLEPGILFILYYAAAAVYELKLQRDMI